MYERAVWIAVLSLLVVGRVNAQQRVVQPAVGDEVILKLTGELAREYSVRMGFPRQNSAGLSIESSATIEQQQSDGKLRVEHQTPVTHEDKPRMVTLTAVVDASQIATDVTPVDTPVHASPAVHQVGGEPTMSKSGQRSYRLRLSGLEGVKLRTWALVDEIGK